ncbi:MAG TPA: ATP-binding protein [Solirubrobacteraceae bacterium]|nr:ATP-binding protein [Solirubrobacteraceae bacterium]
MRSPLRFVFGNCIFATGLDDGWAAFTVRADSYEFLPEEEKRARFQALLAALGGVQADIQILRVSEGWDVARYVRELEQTHAAPFHADAPRAGAPHAGALHECAPHAGAPRECALRERALRCYAREHSERLCEIGAARPRLFVLVSLREPQRDVASFLSRSFEQHPRVWLASLRGTFAKRDRRVLSVAELGQAQARAERARAHLADYLPVLPARGVQLQWLVRRAFCRGLGEPQVEGLHSPRALLFERGGGGEGRNKGCGEPLLAPLEGDVLRWMDSIVENRGRSLRCESERGVSWQAQLVAGSLPEQATFPSAQVELMCAPVESLPFAVDLSLNARFLPNELALRIARRRIQDADQIARAESDGEQGVSELGQHRTHAARELLAYLQSSSRPPLLRATLAIAIGAVSEEHLEKRVQECRRAYGEVRLHRPLGGQLELFWQHFPGQRTRIAGYEDTLTPEQVAAMMPTAAHAVGSRRGFYLGHTLSRSRRPLLFNLREGSETDRNTAILSVGALGSGKTTLDQKLKYEAFLLGARIIDCDPKGDHRFHLLEEVAPHVQQIVLRADPALRGVLDPLRVAPEHLRHDAAVSFLRDLLPGRAQASWETAIVGAVDRVLSRAREPTCGEVVRALEEGDAIDAQVAKALAVYARSGLTQLGFAEPEVCLAPVGERQVIYLPIRDLPGPEPGVRRSEYSQSERVGEQLVRLIAMFAMQLLARERERLKVFSFDEGWRLLGDPVGRALLASLQRMGRSELAVPIVSTQLVTDALLGQRASLENLLGATFAFGMRSQEEAGRALALLGLDPEDSTLRARLLEFERGRCLFRDHRGRVEAVQVDVVAPALLRAFSTTPEVGVT